MRRFILSVILLLSISLHTTAQHLSDRYNSYRPVVVVCQTEYQHEILETLVHGLNLPSKIVKKDKEEGRRLLELGEADLVITDKWEKLPEFYNVSKCIVGYDAVTTDSICELRFAGKDRYLIEQMDAQFIRLEQAGDIYEMRQRWEHPDEVDDAQMPTALLVSDVLLILVVLLGIGSLLVLCHIKSVRRHTKEVAEVIDQAQLLGKSYEIEDNQAAHDLRQKYEAILKNPYVAIAFLDVDGRILYENDTMKRRGHEGIEDLRQPLYNAGGRVDNYLVAVKCLPTI